MNLRSYSSNYQADACNIIQNDVCNMICKIDRTDSGVELSLTAYRAHDVFLLLCYLIPMIIKNTVLDHCIWTLLYRLLIKEHTFNVLWLTWWILCTVQSMFVIWLLTAMLSLCFKRFLRVSSLYFSYSLFGE